MYIVFAKLKTALLAIIYIIKHFCFIVNSSNNNDKTLISLIFLPTKISQPKNRPLKIANFKDFLMVDDY